jgi:hypothetical protein
MVFGLLGDSLSDCGPATSDSVSNSLSNLSNSLSSVILLTVDNLSVGWLAP